MYELVLIHGEKEFPFVVKAKELDAELVFQMHVRSIASGVIDVRKTKKIAAKKK